MLWQHTVNLATQCSSSCRLLLWLEQAKHDVKLLGIRLGVTVKCVRDTEIAVGLGKLFGTRFLDPPRYWHSTDRTYSSTVWAARTVNCGQLTNVSRDLVKSLSTLYQSLHRHLATCWHNGIHGHAQLFIQHLLVFWLINSVRQLC